LNNFFLIHRVSKEASDAKDKYYAEVGALERALITYSKASKEKEEASRSTINQLQQELKNVSFFTFFFLSLIMRVIQSNNSHGLMATIFVFFLA